MNCMSSVAVASDIDATMDAASSAAIVLMLQAPLMAQAQTPWTARDHRHATAALAELVSSNGVPSTIVLADQQVRMAFRTPPGLETSRNSGDLPMCQPQYVRYFTGVGAVPVIPPGPGPYPDPQPGPTLRARVGDVIQLTLLNHVNPSDFGDSIDRAENGLKWLRLQHRGYPGKDIFPDCFMDRARETSISWDAYQRTGPATMC